MYVQTNVSMHVYVCVCVCARACVYTKYAHMCHTCAFVCIAATAPQNSKRLSDNNPSDIQHGIH